MKYCTYSRKMGISRIPLPLQQIFGVLFRPTSVILLTVGFLVAFVIMNVCSRMQNGLYWKVALIQITRPDSNSGENCLFSWRATENHRVSSSQRDSTSVTIESCQEACINRTTCTGIDFNRAHTCFLVISNPAKEIHPSNANHDDQKHVAAEGFVHFDLSRDCSSAADYVDNTKKHDMRILCLVLTTPKNHLSKAIHILATWGRRCNKLLFITEKNDTAALPTLHVQVEIGRKYLTKKMMKAFQHVYEHHLNDADWFLKVDDDTYVIMENLRYFLSAHDPKDPVYFGHPLKVGTLDIASGGAGYVMSREALKRLGSRQQGLCHESRGDEDVEIAECLKRLGVEFGESRDALGRNRFLCFDPEREIHGEFPPWYYKMDKYGAKKGIESISDNVITFHYVSPKHLYDLEFYIYHMRLTSALSKLRKLNRKEKAIIRSPTTRAASSIPVTTASALKSSVKSKPSS